MTNIKFITVAPELDRVVFTNEPSFMGFICSFVLISGAQFELLYKHVLQHDKNIEKEDLFIVFFFR